MESMREGGSDQAGSGGVSRLPREAVEGVMRAWLEILRERHPEVTWIIGEEIAAACHSAVRPSGKARRYNQEQRPRAKAARPLPPLSASAN